MLAGPLWIAQAALPHLCDSGGVIINIDYPLGMAAYRVLREVMENIVQVRGVYILGKAATLNGSIGDVMMSNVVLDERGEPVILDFGLAQAGSDHQRLTSENRAELFGELREVIAANGGDVPTLRSTLALITRRV